MYDSGEWNTYVVIGIDGDHRVIRQQGSTISIEVDPHYDSQMPVLRKKEQLLTRLKKVVELLCLA